MIVVADGMPGYRRLSMGVVAVRVFMGMAVRLIVEAMLVIFADMMTLMMGVRMLAHRRVKRRIARLFSLGRIQHPVLSRVLTNHVALHAFAAAAAAGIAVTRAPAAAA